MKDEILKALRDIEGSFGVRVLLAVESGSRAWGFASPDSDFDVRFIYAHPRDWYVSVLEQRDVIEQMLPGDLDVSGWDLRKTLRLFARCNLALNEWLGSPVTYSEDPMFRAQLASLIPKYFNPIAGTHHYLKMARTAWSGHFSHGEIGIKKIFYVLRPLFACRWIERMRTQPPTEFARLLAAEWVTGEERRWVNGLLERKLAAKEAEPIRIDTRQAQALNEEIARFEAIAPTLATPEKQTLDDLDLLLRGWIAQQGCRLT
jgi:predicted nucleotidyltransferase